ncbi:hypothetical protein HanIR_Chr08g0383601 [Helianthus annuus]|nr:hypothetical protein HanIR_Chr08g0383601 [Helianthus annuus]
MTPFLYITILIYQSPLFFLHNLKHLLVLHIRHTRCTIFFCHFKSPCFLHKSKCRLSGLVVLHNPEVAGSSPPPTYSLHNLFFVTNR